MVVVSGRPIVQSSTHKVGVVSGRPIVLSSTQKVGVVSGRPGPYRVVLTKWW